MATFIFRFPGDRPPSEDLDRIRAEPTLKVLDATSKMFLVDAGTSTVTGLKKELPGWIITRERSTPRPDTKHHVHKPPQD